MVSRAGVADESAPAIRAMNQEQKAVLWIVGIVFFFIAAMVLYPPLDIGSAEVARRFACVHNLKEIGIALQNYHDRHKCYPPAYVADSQGRPMHSWRALLLPYFEVEQIVNIGKLYYFNEPWNGPNNRRIAEQIPHVYRCPSDEENTTQTNYVAIVGPETGWPAPGCMNNRDITDGPPDTIAVVEAVDAGIHWMEPRDLTIDLANDVRSNSIAPGISSRHWNGFNALFFDSAVHFLPADTSPTRLRAMLTAKGGEHIEPIEPVD